MQKAALVDSTGFYCLYAKYKAESLFHTDMNMSIPSGIIPSCFPYTFLRN